MYLCLCESEQPHKQGEGEAEGEAGSIPSKEPDMGLDPRTRGHDFSRRQTPNHLSHQVPFPPKFLNTVPLPLLCFQLPSSKLLRKSLFPASPEYVRLRSRRGIG